jgi:hypothetical protein
LCASRRDDHDDGPATRCKARHPVAEGGEVDGEQAGHEGLAGPAPTYEIYRWPARRRRAGRTLAVECLAVLCWLETEESRQEGAPCVPALTVTKQGRTKQGWFIQGGHDIDTDKPAGDWLGQEFSISFPRRLLATFGEPVWPDLALTQILEKAFRDAYIKDRNHPFVKSIGLGQRD